MPGLLVQVYCSVDDLSNILSLHGLNLRNDDYPPILWGNAIAQAASEMNGYCLRRYEIAQLQNSYWMQFNSAIMACYRLCGRRGNPRPASLAADRKEVVEYLKMIFNGGWDIPEVPPRKSEGPAMSNLFAKLAPQPHIRVDLRASSLTTGQPTAYQRVIDLSQWTDSWKGWPMA